jgi:hypothetical protein
MGFSPPQDPSGTLQLVAAIYSGTTGTLDGGSLMLIRDAERERSGLAVSSRIWRERQPGSTLNLGAGPRTLAVARYL